MSAPEKFTFGQATLNIIVTCSLVVGLAYSHSKTFYQNPLDLAVVLTVIATSCIALYFKYRDKNKKLSAKNISDDSRGESDDQKA